MSKRKKIFIGIGVVSGIILAVVAVFVGNNILNQPKVTIEQTDNISVDDVREVATDTSNVLRQGELLDGDSVHKASGAAKIIKTDKGAVLKLDDFSVLDGPDLFVYLSPNKHEQGLGEDFISLGSLKDNKGEQVYNLPEDYDDLKSVVIWCRAFSVTFAKANLE